MKPQTAAQEKTCLDYINKEWVDGRLDLDCILAKDELHEISLVKVNPPQP